MKYFQTTAVVTLLWLGSALATAPNLVHYQGFLADTGGIPVTDSTYSVTFAIYATSSGGTALWTENQSLSTQDGLFSVLLGAVVPLDPDIFNDSARYLGTAVEGSELTPRVRLASAPYGLVASRIRGDVESGENSLAIRRPGSDTAIFMDTSGIYLLGSTLYSDSVSASRLVPGAPYPSLRRTTIGNGRLTSKSQDAELDLTPGEIVILGGATPDTTVKVNKSGVTLFGTDLTGINLFNTSDTAIRISMGTGEPSISLHDNAALSHLTLRASSGYTVVHGPSGTDAIYSASGVQLTGPGLKRMAAGNSTLSFENPTGTTFLSLDASSSTDGGRLWLGGGGGGGSSSLSGDSLSMSGGGGSGGGKIFLRAPASKSLELDASAIKFRSGSDSARIRESVGDIRIESKNYTLSYSQIEFPSLKFTISDTDLGKWHSWFENFVIGDGGTLLCSSNVEIKSVLSADFDRDGTLDLVTAVSPSPTVTLPTGTSLDCLGPAEFGSPVLVSADLTVTGALTVFGPKAFAHEHPTDPNLQIIYVALEGNEVGTYTRGTAQLRDGRAEIPLPKDFAMVTGPDGLTAQLTPRGPVCGMLYIEAVSPTLLHVGSSNAMDRDVRFDFVVNGIRRGFEAHQVIQRKQALANQ